MIIKNSTRKIGQIVEESLAIQQAVGEDMALIIAHVAGEILSAFQNGRKLLVFGNGGSAADAQHLAAELVGRFEKEREPYPVIALTTDTSILTALANDYGVEKIFSRQIEAIGHRGDVIMAISTSGDSPNVLMGIHAARRLGLRCIGMTGEPGGELAGLVDLSLCVPSQRTARIQEAHVLIIHLLCSLIEEGLPDFVSHNQDG